MRKDVKIGLSIGGVLLLVLVIYLLGPAAKKPDVAVDNPPPAPPQAPVPPPPAPITTVAKDDDIFGKGDEPLVEETEHKNPGHPGAASDDPWTRAFNSPETLMATTRTPKQQEAQAPVNDDIDLANDTDQARQAVLVEHDASRNQGTEASHSSPAKTTLITPGSKTHVVREGETFSSIAQSVYGDARHFQEIQEANPQIDATRMQPGMTINLPEISRNQRAGPMQVSQKSIDSSKEYRVGPSESLYSISLKLYGKSDRVDALYQANRETIGADPAMIRVGMVLKLPETPRATTSR